MIHTHRPGVLVIGCPACIEQVRRDQERAYWAEGPLRRCTFTLPDRTRSSVSADLRIPAGAHPDDVTEHYARTLEAMIAAAHPDIAHSDDLIDLMVSGTRCSIGPIIDDIQVAPTADHPSLFEVA